MIAVAWLDPWHPHRVQYSVTRTAAIVTRNQRTKQDLFCILRGILQYYIDITGKGLNNRQSFNSKE
jgi:hypothetical protein